MWRLPPCARSRDKEFLPQVHEALSACAKLEQRGFRVGATPGALSPPPGPQADPDPDPDPQAAGAGGEPASQPQVLLRYWTVPVPLGAAKLRPGLFHVVTQRASLLTSAVRRSLELFHADLALHLAAGSGRLDPDYPVLAKLRAAGACFVPHTASEVAKSVAEMGRQRASLAGGVTLWTQAGGPALQAPTRPSPPSATQFTCPHCGSLGCTVLHTLACPQQRRPPQSSEPTAPAPPAARAGAPLGPQPTRPLLALPQGALVQGLYGILSKELRNHVFRTLLANMRGQHLKAAVREYIGTTFGLASSLTEAVMQGFGGIEPPPLIARCLQQQDAAGWSLGQLCTSYRTACRPSGPQQSVSSAGKWDDTTLTAAVTAAFEIRHHLGIAVAAQWSRRVRAGLEDGTRPPVRPPVVPQAAWGPRPLTVRPKDAVDLAHLADAHRYAAVVGSAGSL